MVVEISKQKTIVNIARILKIHYQNIFARKLLLKQIKIPKPAHIKFKKLILLGFNIISFKVILSICLPKHISVKQWVSTLNKNHCPGT